jgi:hypothetical protein
VRGADIGHQEERKASAADVETVTPEQACSEWDVRCRRLGREDGEFGRQASAQIGGLATNAQRLDRDQSHSSTVVIQLNTPGREIAMKMDYVNRRGLAQDPVR